MINAGRALKAFAGVLVICTSLGSCQRASYSFHPPGGSARTQATDDTPLAPVPETKVDAEEMAPAQPLRPRPHQTPRPISRRSGSFTRQKQKPTSALTSVPCFKNRISKQQPAFSQSLNGPGDSDNNRSKVTTLLLLLPGLGPLGLYRFYLSYPVNGASRIGLVILSAVLVGTKGSAYALLSSIGFTILIGLVIWWLWDLVRVLTNRLKPKNGEYGPAAS
jgi:hypothetical protein